MTPTCTPVGLSFTTPKPRGLTFPLVLKLGGGHRLEGDLRMAGKAPGTIQQYLSSIRGFEAFLGQEMDQATPDEIRGWVGHLQRQPIGAARLRCHYSALTFLYRKTLGQPEKVAFISMPRSDAPLPVILTPTEVQRVLGSFTTAKYRAFFTLDLRHGTANPGGSTPPDSRHRCHSAGDPRAPR